MTGTRSWQERNGSCSWYVSIYEYKDGSRYRNWTTSGSVARPGPNEYVGLGGSFSLLDQDNNQPLTSTES